VFVTCHGAKQKDSESLQKMKLDKPGFPSSVFPWDGKDKENHLATVTLDLSDTQAVKGRGEVKRVGLHCQAWAENIETEQRAEDKVGEAGGAAGRPRGGGFTVLCFNDGKIQSSGKHCLKA
jgi:hypothetical protein